VRDSIAAVQVSRFYLLVAIPAGLFFALLVPPSQVLDESAHFFRVWQVSSGNVAADSTFDPNSGDEVTTGTYDRCVREYMTEFGRVAAAPQPFVWRDFWLDTPDCSPQVREQVVGEPMGTYSLWSYPGHTVGVAVGRAVGLPLPVTFYLGRLLGLAASITMCWWAIRLAPRLQLLLASVALMPMALIGAAGFSPDGMVLGCALVLIASCLRFSAQDAPAPRRLDIAVIVAASSALVVSKPPYAVFLLLFAAYRPQLFGSTRATVQRLAAMAAVPLVAMVLWARFGYPSGALVAAGDVDPGRQVRWVAGHPLEYLNVLSDSVFHWETQEFVMKGWVGAFGMFRTGSPETPLMLTGFVILAALLLGALVATEAGPRLAVAGRADAVRTWVPLGVSLLGVLGLYTSAYLSWTPVASPLITGVQGRYLLAFIALPGVTVALRRQRSNAAVGMKVAGVAIAVLFAAAAVKVIAYFY